MLISSELQSGFILTDLCSSSTSLSHTMRKRLAVAMPTIRKSLSAWVGWRS